MELRTAIISSSRVAKFAGQYRRMKIHMRVAGKNPQTAFSHHAFCAMDRNWNNGRAGLLGQIKGPFFKWKKLARYGNASPQENW